MDDSKRLYVILSTNAAAYRREMRQSSRDTKQFGDDLDDASDSSRRLSSEINSMSGRIGIMLDALALVGPAVVPIGAVAVPAMAGLANLTFSAALGAGAAAVAFIGLGDAVGAIREAELEPTAENLAEVVRTMDALSPAARRMAGEVTDLLPSLLTLRDSAAQGFFPGAIESLDELDNMLPRISDLLYTYADAVGDVAAEGADAFDSRRGRQFTRFLEGEARPAIKATYDILANLTGGMANLWMAMDPANDDFTDWLVRSSEKFDQWSKRVDDTEGFEDFLDYLSETGPEVGETLVALADGMLQILEAAAPMGGVVLDGLQAFGEVIANIADSPFGPTIFAGLAAVTALNRGLAITASLMTKAGMTAPGGGAVSASPAGVFGAVGGIGSRGSSGLKSYTADLRKMRDGSIDAYRAGERVRETTKNVGKAAGGAALGMGALYAMSTDTGQSLGVTNTAMGGMIGLMFGPWGAAAGAAAGYGLDFAKSIDTAHDAIDAFEGRTSGNFNVSGYRESLDRMKADTDAWMDKVTGESFLGHMGTSLTPGGARNNIDLIFGGFEGSELEKQTLAQIEAEKSMGDLDLAGQMLAKGMGVVRNSVDNTQITVGQMDAALLKAAPAMNALGITTEDLMHAAADGSLMTLIGRIQQYQIKADTTQGRTKEFASSVADLGNEALSTAESAEVMASALDALLSPFLDAEAATDAWHQSLKTLRTDLDADAGFKGFGKKAMENKGITRDYVETSKSRLEALAGLTETTEEDMARAVAATRKEFIEHGIAAGIDRDVITARADALGLTPKLVRTVFEAAGITEADLKVRALKESMKKLPPKVRTVVATEGIPKTKADLDALVEKYGLTEKQRTALVTLRDLASGDIAEVLALLRETDESRPRPRVDADTNPAKSALESLLGFLGVVDGTTARVYTKHVSIGGPQPTTAGEPQPTRQPTKPKPTRGADPRATTPTYGNAGDGRGYSGGTTIVRNGAPLIGALTVPEGAGESDGRAHRMASAVVREVSLAQRSGRWSSTGDD